MSFMEKLLTREYHPSQEINNIEDMLDEYFGYEETSMRKCIEKNFKDWQYRKNYINLSQIYQYTNVGRATTLAKKDIRISIPTEYFYDYLEFIINILEIAHYIGNSRMMYATDCTNAKHVKDNVDNILETMNLQIVVDQKDGYKKIVQKDWKVTDAAEVVGDDYDLGQKIYLYNHHSLKRKLFDKADILCRLYKYFEKGLSKKLKANNQTDLETKISDMSNKLDVRHAPSKAEKILLEGITEEEQEVLYDNLFNLYLEAIILISIIDNKKDIKQLLEKIKEKTIDKTILQNEKNKQDTAK